MRRLSVQAKVSTLALAAGLVAGPSPAFAQFVGSIDSSAGIDTVNSNNSNLIITGQQAVINWTATNNPSGGQIVFLPDSNSATFTGTSNFAVLNRITPGTAGNAIYMGGSISSLVNTSVGGTVYFYSPNGIVIGANAAINVGSLGLTTLPISDDGNGNWMTGFGGANPTVVFGQATDPNSFIRTETAIDGSIRSNGSGSYVALVAPSIEHKGVIRTDGAAALVAAEAATITFSNSNLYTITVTTGTDAATGVNVNGGTIERNSAVEGADHRAYLVAVAKNDAVTMLINNGGSIGFDTATSAQNGENNVVILGGGYNVGGGELGSQSGVSQVNLTISNATLSSNVDAAVTGGAAINSGQGDLLFSGDLSIISGETTTVGGNALVEGLNGNALTIGGNLYVRAARRNGDGSVTGLISKLGAEGGSVVTVNGNVELDSDSFGADSFETGVNGGNAIGGNAQINIGANSTLHVLGSADVHADGTGGSAIGGDATAGNGRGGQALIMAINGGSSVTIDGSVYASAQGFGGGTGECSVCNVTGGNGTGGNASVHTNIGINSMTLGSDVEITAEGWGGAGDAQAGTGLGGLANLGAGDGSSLSVAADSEVDATGHGGYGFDSAAGGLGRGGTAQIGANANGSTTDLTGTVFVIANGEGGDGLSGGIGTGGIANIAAIQGTVHAFNDVEVTADSNGGLSTVQGGTGGDGLADIESTVTPEMTEASLFASAGTLQIDGITLVTANARGGDGGFDGGQGGNAVAAGVPGVIDGGAAIHAANSDAGTSTILLGTVVVTADAQGGNGGSGQGGTNGTDGGDGGSATAGKAVITAAAGSGDLTAGQTILSASATGGQGGDGGNGDGGSSGNGGNGGDATGGFINVGTESGNPNFAVGANNGQATFTSIIAIADATGGNGGSFTFGNPAGIAGDGGDARGGNSVLLVRGSHVTVGTVLLDASATGGDGGMDPNDTPQGTGGDATTGSVGVIVTNRFQHADQRGTLTAGTIAGTAIATGGQGAVLGGQWAPHGGATFQVINSDVTADSIGLAVVADSISPNLPEFVASEVTLIDSTVNLTGGFSLTTPGKVSVHVNDSTPLTQAFTAATFNISADNFVHDETRALPTQVGTIGASSITLSTAQNLVLDAHLRSAGSLDLFAPGLIDIRNANSTGGDLNLDAGDTINGGALVAAGSVNAFANGNVTLGSINAGTSIDIESTDGNIALGALTAATFINLETAGNIGFGNATSDLIDFEAGGNVNGGNIVAGTEASGEAGGTVTLGDLNVGVAQTGGAAENGFAVGIGAIGSITVGNVIADEAIGFATEGNLTTGTLNAGTNVMTLVGGNTTIASITTPGSGRTYHGDVQMFYDAGGPDDFVPSLVLNSAPVRSGGSYSVTGAVSTGRMDVGAQSISTGAITASNAVTLDSATSVISGAIGASLVDIDAGTSIATGNINSGDTISLLANSGAITIGNASAVNLFEAFAGTGLTTGAVSASDIQAVAGGTATIGGAWSAGDVFLTSNDIDITGSGSISGGDIALLSTNATQTVVGDGVSGGGYQLSNAEYSRLHSNDINVVADTGLGAAPKMLIGDLTVDGSDSEAIHDYEFVVWDGESELPSGSIRVVGDAVFTNMGTAQTVTFTTNRFELDAATGLLSLEQGPGVLGGQLFLDAAHIHVASGTILDQLAVDPQYDGYRDDLNAPALVQRPDGVIRAAVMEIEFADGGPATLNTLYVQNTGTSETPAGFVVGDGVLFGEGSEVTPPAGSIDLVINGQIVTGNGTLTGVAVRDALVASEGDLSPFTSTSTINGCLLTGDCGGSGPVIPPGSTATPGIQDEVTLINDDVFPEPPFGNEDVIDDNDEDTDEGETSPIVPPEPLFDTSELADAAGGTEAPEVGTSMRSTPGLTNTGDIDDPVSGSGNPGLMESPPPPPANEEKQP